MGVSTGRLTAHLFTDVEAPTVGATLRRHPSLLLYVVTIGLELVLPLLIWRTPLPDDVHLVVDLLVALMVFGAITKMLTTDRVPTAMLLVVAATTIGAIVATFEGQAPLATVWGWWLMFRYPMVGVFVYMHPEWPRSVARWTIRSCFVVVGIEVLLQLLQIASGQGPGDFTAGSFGRYGVTPLLMFIYLALSFAFGKWLIQQDWRPVVAMLLLGAISSALGGMRVFPVGAVLIAGVALLLHLLRGGNLGRAFLLVCAFGIGISIFVTLSNNVSRSESSYWGLVTDVDQLQQYFSNPHYRADSGVYRLGRSYAIQYGWEQLRRDHTTLLFGYGLGARSNSSSLGVKGAAIEQSDYGVTQGTSALNLMQELGLGGLLVLASLFIWLIIAYGRAVHNGKIPAIRIVATGLILFTAVWPLWLWYSIPWSHTVAMLLYWGMTGLVLQHTTRIR